MAYRFKCSTCDKWHEGLPDVGYREPLVAADVPQTECAKRLFLTSDLCVLDNEHFFVRCMLFLPNTGADERFGWGVWSTLSQANFLRYQEHYDEDLSRWNPMFGYLSNRLPGFPDTLNLKLSVQPERRGMRPTVTLEPTDHPLAVAQRDGISIEKVLEIVEPFLHWSLLRVKAEYCRASSRLAAPACCAASSARG